MAEVRFEGVTKVYPSGVRAVERLSLTLADRELQVLVGPSGCGKTTTLRLLAGLEVANEGAISIDGRIVNDVAPKDRDIAMVFQQYALYPHMTVYRNMAFGLLLRADAGWLRQGVRLLFDRAAFRRARDQVRAIREKVEETADLLGIRPLLGRRPRALSGGQQQRVALGRAIVRRPRVFLFDEPLSNLDAKLRAEMRGELKRLIRSLGATALYVTHDQEEAMALGDRVAVMKDGTIRQCDRPLDLYRCPASRFVAEFVGSPTMNFVTGRLQSRNGRLWFERESMRLPLTAQMATRLASFGEREAVLGFRSEAIRGTGRGTSTSVEPETSIETTVSAVEALGERTDVRLETAAGTAITWRAEADVDIREGQRMPIAVDMDRVHVFGTGEDGMNWTLDADGESRRV